MAIFSWVRGKPFGFNVKAEKGILTVLSKTLFRRAIISLTVSPVFTETIEKEGGRAETIRPMIEDGEEHIVENRAYFDKATFRLLYIGRVESAKGSYDLVRAIKILHDNGDNNFILDIIGCGADLTNIVRLTAEEGLSPRIHFHGMISDRDLLRTFYRQADLFILPTHNEGFPRVLYEAMIAGTPILTTFVGAIPYLMKNGINCYEIAPKNPEDIADKIARVIGDYPNAARVAINGTQTVREYLKDKKESHAAQLMRILHDAGVDKREKYPAISITPAESRKDHPPKMKSPHA